MIRHSPVPRPVLSCAPTLAALGLTLAMLACTLGAPSTRSAQSQGTTSPSQPGEAAQPISPGNPAPSSGDLVSSNSLLPDPEAGLAGLQSYSASFDRSIRGTVEGKEYTQESHYKQSRIAASGDIGFSKEIQTSDSPELFYHYAKIGHSVYTQQARDQDCSGKYYEKPDDMGFASLASLLLPVTQAAKVADESVSGIASAHYQLGQDSLPLETDGSTVSGDVWIAEPGGYVVKYLLHISPPDKPTGKGLEASQEWNYEIAQVDGLDQVAVPEGCTPVMEDIPALPDAQSLVRLSGWMHYKTPSGAAQVVDFYNQKLVDLGWQTEEKLPSAGEKPPFSVSYVQNDQRLSISVSSSEGGKLLVMVTLNPYTQPPTTSEPTEEPTPEGQDTEEPTPEG